MTANEGDEIRTLVDVDFGGLMIPAGAEGHVLEVLENPRGYLVELVIREATETEDGDFVATGLLPEEIEVIRRDLGT
jgi:hypothetical protein